MKRPARAIWSMVMVGLIVGAAAAACSAAGQGVAAAGSGGAGSTGSPTASSAGMGGGLVFDANGASGAGGGLSDDAACTAVSSTATSKIQPADIIIAVDTSGSMSQEKAQVQQNLNNFATIITNSGIDVHVILLADNGVTIPPPLGSGGAVDENLPTYRHVLQGVDSNNALDLFIQTYPMWKSSLRPDASKTFAVVSDDNADMTPAAFTAALLALDPPTFQGFKVDAIVSSQDPVVCTASCAASFCTMCGKCCPLCIPISAAQGTVYEQLIQQTGGVLGDLCAQDFAPMFASMAKGVVQGSKLSCNYPIPPVPGGGTIDPNKVNVNYTPGGASMGTPILNVPNGLPDCGPNGGWYYDNPQAPTEIIMCPASCMTLQADPGGKVDVLFGCVTQMVPPK